MSNIDSTPEISIIVPVYNGKKYIRDCLESLVSQDYASDLYEIIIVDNGSSDGTLDIIKEFSVTLLHENKKSSYAARNKGLSAARGKYIAFTDSDCKVDKSWLSNYMKCMEETKADLIGGDVRFYFTNLNSPAELLDSFIHMRNDILVSTRKLAVTANLFIKTEIIHNIGKFNQELKSGGDFEFTKRATDNGLILTFCKNAYVNHPTRNFDELITKSKRVGIGHAKLSSVKESKLKILFGVVKLIIRPPKIRFWQKHGNTRNTPIGFIKAIRVDFVHKYIEIISKYHYLKELNRISRLKQI